MSPRHEPSKKSAEALANLLRKLPTAALIALFLVAVGVAIIVYFLSRPSGQPGPALAGPPGTYLFCSWNVENFFDDQDDPNNDDKLEDWFAQNPDMFRLKADRLAEGLLKMNDGRGPDIIALCEVESAKCMNTLKAALNDRLDKAGKGDSKFENVLFRIDTSGRRFAPGIITRLAVDADRTHKFAKFPNSRTLEGHIKVNGHELVVLAAHWTSRVDRGGKGDEEHANADRRMSYAKDCYGRFKAILTENPAADVILCGDFNDEFRDAALRDGLHASADPEEVKNAVAMPRPLALFANLASASDPPGTIYGRSRWSTFDHICIARGLLDDAGWTCEPNTAAIFSPAEFRRSGKKSKGEPFKFGDAKTLGERGYSDHFPVTVRLRVQAIEGQ